MPPPTTSHRASKRSGFTLVELLVVIGIIGLLFALVMPAFTGMGRGQAIRSATTQVRATAALARQWAITHREKTFMIFPDDVRSYTAGTGGKATMALRCYAVWGDRSGYISEWSYLPPGIVFNADATNTMNLFAAGADRQFGVRFPSDSSPSQTMYCISFTPDGRLNQSGGTRLGVYLGEGWTDVDAVTQTVTALTIKPGSVQVGVEFLPLTGQGRVRGL